MQEIEVTANFLQFNRDVLFKNKQQFGIVPGNQGFRPFPAHSIAARRGTGLDDIIQACLNLIVGPHKAKVFEK